MQRRLFKGYDFAGRQVYWDSKTQRLYEKMPELRRLRRFELVKQDAAYMFPLQGAWAGLLVPERRGAGLCHRKGFIIGKHLIVNDKKEQFRMNFLDSAKE